MNSTFNQHGWNKVVHSREIIHSSHLWTEEGVIHFQLAGVALILLCAAMMARGVGFFG